MAYFSTAYGHIDAFLIHKSHEAQRYLVKQKPDLGRAWGRGGWEEKGRRFKKKIGSKVNRFWETESQKK